MKLRKFFINKNQEKKKIITSFSLLLFLTGFILGNLFGINFYFIKWNTFSIFLVPGFLELGNFLSNRLNNEYSNFKNEEWNQNSKSKLFQIKLFDSIKRGFLLGIFIEAFKVGS
jgi:hypothetical protein